MARGALIESDGIIQSGGQSTPLHKETKSIKSSNVSLSLLLSLFTTFRTLKPVNKCMTGTILIKEKYLSPLFVLAMSDFTLEV